MGIIKSIFKSPQALAARLQNLDNNERVIYLNKYGDTKTNKPDANATEGSTGTKMQGYQFNEEYLPDLKGYKGAETYDKMMRQDYQVSCVENATIEPIKSANFHFSIPDVKNGDLHAELCDWQLKKGLNKTLNENLNDWMSYLTFGFAAFEPTDWRPYNHKKFGLIWKLHTFGFRDQKSITGWKITDDDVEYITQQALSNGVYSNKNIRGENLIILSNKRRGSNFEGVSMFRAAYGCYWRKQIYLQILGIGLEKSALGMIIVKVPAGKLGTPEETAFIEGVKNYITHENSYLKTSNGKDEKAFVVEVVTIDFKSDAVINAIKHEDSAISKAGGVQFSELGQGGNGGSYGLGVSQVDFHLTMLKNKAMYIGEKFQPIWDNLIIYNFGEQDEYPELQISGLDDAVGEALARVLNMFIVSGLFKPTAEDEAYLRKAFNMPERNEETAAPATEPAAPDDAPDGDDTDDIVDEPAEPAADAADGLSADNNNSEKLTEQPAAYVNKINKGIDFKKFSKQYDELKDSYFKTVNASLLAIQSKYINDVGNAIKFNPKNPLKAIINLSFGSTKQLEKTIDKNLIAGINTGQGQAKEIIKAKDKKKKLTADDTSAFGDISAHVRKWKNNTSAITISAMTGDFKKKAEIAAETAIGADLPAKNILFDIQNAMDSFRNNENNLGGGALIPKSLEQGRNDEYKKAEVELTGWMYRNLEPVTAICQWLNNRTIQDNNPDVDVYSPPNHWSCKSFKIPIFSDEEQPAGWDGWDVPASVAAAQQLLTNSGGCCINTPTIYKFLFEKGVNND